MALEAITLRKRGMSLRQIGAYLDIPKTSVDRLLKIEGLQVPEEPEE